jgi:hypothetical protein
VICYHGTPITPDTAAVAALTGRHGLVSFAAPQQIELVAGTCDSFIIDNGAFSSWKSGAPITDWLPYYKFCSTWLAHPACDWALIPDVIDGTEDENKDLVCRWMWGHHSGVPIWHLHESLGYLEWLVSFFGRIAIGSSGDYKTPGTDVWWRRIAEAMEVLCHPSGHPKVKIHGLRMMRPDLRLRIPFASVDSSTVARAVGIDSRWSGTYAPPTKDARAALVALRLENSRVTSRWLGQPAQMNAQLNMDELLT